MIRVLNAAFGLIVALAMCFGFGSALAAGVLDNAKARGALNVLWVRDSAPFSSAGEGGRPAGYAIDLCQQVATAVAPTLAIAWREVSLAEGLDAVAGSTGDLLCGPVTITLPRLSRMDFTSPILIGGPGVLLRKGAPAALSEWLDPSRQPAHSLRAMLLYRGEPKRVAVVAGSTGAAWLDALIAREGLSLNVVPVPAHGDAARLLAAGNVEAWVGEWAVLASRAAGDPALATAKLLPRPLEGEPLALALPRDEAFRLAAETALVHAIRAPGFEALLSRWLGHAGLAEAATIRAMTPLE